MKRIKDACKEAGNTNYISSSSVCSTSFYLQTLPAHSKVLSPSFILPLLTYRRSHQEKKESLHTNTFPNGKFQILKGKRDHSESESGSVVSDSLLPHGLYGPWNSPSQNTAVGSISLLQGIFPTQGSNPLPHCTWFFTS